MTPVIMVFRFQSSAFRTLLIERMNGGSALGNRA